MAGKDSGDRLARGLVRAQFTGPENVSQEKWDDAFKDFDPEKYRRDADLEKAGVSSLEE